MGLFYYFDPMYFAYMIPAVLLLFVSNILVSSRISKYSKRRSEKGYTGAQAAKAVLQEHGIFDVTVQPVPGNLTDHYNPATKIIGLSESVIDSGSIAAIGIAAHEAGHAVQHAKGYFPLRIRNTIVPVCNFGSSLSVPLLLLGVFLNMDLLINLGLLLFALLVVFQLITLPVEFDASRRAVRCIDQAGLLEEEELGGAKKVLTAAALTYVASMLQSLLLLLYYYQRFAGRRR